MQLWALKANSRTFEAKAKAKAIAPEAEAKAKAKAKAIAPEAEAEAKAKAKAIAPEAEAKAIKFCLEAKAWL